MLNVILASYKEVQEAHVFFQNNKDFFLDCEKGHVYRISITMPILQIGELVKHLPDEFLKIYSKIQWEQIKGMRYIFGHRYDSVDFKLMWNGQMSTMILGEIELCKGLDFVYFQCYF